MPNIANEIFISKLTLIKIQVYGKILRNIVISDSIFSAFEPE